MRLAAGVLALDVPMKTTLAAAVRFVLVLAVLFAAHAATVPGGITTDLQRAAVIPDPHIAHHIVGSGAAVFALDAPGRATPQRGPPLSSWGGNFVHNPKDGLYHLFAAAMGRSCSLGAWTTNSFVIHATSSNVTGPFAYRDTALPRWHHNPQAVLAADGTWYYLGRSIFTMFFTHPHKPHFDI